RLQHPDPAPDAASRRAPAHAALAHRRAGPAPAASRRLRQHHACADPDPPARQHRAERNRPGRHRRAARRAAAPRRQPPAGARLLRADAADPGRRPDTGVRACRPARRPAHPGRRAGPGRGHLRPGGLRAGHHRRHHRRRPGADAGPWGVPGPRPPVPGLRARAGHPGPVCERLPVHRGRACRQPRLGRRMAGRCRLDQHRYHQPPVCLGMPLPPGGGARLRLGLAGARGAPRRRRGIDDGLGPGADGRPAVIGVDSRPRPARRPVPPYNTPAVFHRTTMTYCVAARLDAGLVFLSDSRTNAGVDQISVARKLNVFEQPGDRVMVLLTSGNLAISQAVVNLLAQLDGDSPDSLWSAPDMYEAARRVGEAVRRVHDRDAEALSEHGVDFNINLIFGGQIGAERGRLFQIYSAGNFIESSPDVPYVQVGEANYGKPILDRVLRPDTSLDEATKCALISMDSTLRSNISVGLPLDMLVYESGALRVTHFAHIDEDNEYFRMIRKTWGERLRQVFGEIADPSWTEAQATGSLAAAGRLHQPHRLTPGGNTADPAPLQVLAQDPGRSQAS